MILKQTQLIFGTTKKPLIVLAEYQIDPAKFNFKKSRKELLEYLKTKGEKGQTWGYFPNSGYEPAEEYPETTKLVEDIKTHFIANMEDTTKKKMTIAFIRVAEDTTVPGAEGERHIDVNKGIKLERNNEEMDDDTKILRGLANFGEYPRDLEVAARSADELRKMGVDIPNDKYQPVILPDSIPLLRIPIPGRVDNSLYVLYMWTDELVHVGRTDYHGQFLCAIGTYVNAKTGYQLI